MPAAAWGRCAFRKHCPVQGGRDGYHLEHTAQQRPVAGRRREQQTEVFRQRYRPGNGIKSTNRGLKRRTGLGHLRVRGHRRVFQALYLKIAGWNLLRAAVCAKRREFVRAKAQTAVLALATGLGTTVQACGQVLTCPPRGLWAFHDSAPDSRSFTLAA